MLTSRYDTAPRLSCDATTEEVAVVNQVERGFGVQTA